MLDLADTLSIEHPFAYSDNLYDRIRALSKVDLACLYRILLRARIARSVGITIPIEKLLMEQPL